MCLPLAHGELHHLHRPDEERGADRLGHVEGLSRAVVGVVGAGFRLGARRRIAGIDRRRVSAQLVDDVRALITDPVQHVSRLLAHLAAHVTCLLAGWARHVARAFDAVRE